MAAPSTKRVRVVLGEYNNSKSWNALISCKFCSEGATLKGRLEFCDKCDRFFCEDHKNHDPECVLSMFET